MHPLDPYLPSKKEASAGEAPLVSARLFLQTGYNGNAKNTESPDRVGTEEGVVHPLFEARVLIYASN